MRLRLSFKIAPESMIIRTPCGRLQRGPIGQRQAVVGEADLVAEVIARCFQQTVDASVADHANGVTGACGGDRSIDFAIGIADGAELPTAGDANLVDVQRVVGVVGDKPEVEQTTRSTIGVAVQGDTGRIEDGVGDAGTEIDPQFILAFGATAESRSRQCSGRNPSCPWR